MNAQNIYWLDSHNVFNLSDKELKIKYSGTKFIKVKKIIAIKEYNGVYLIQTEEPLYLKFRCNECFYSFHESMIQVGSVWHIHDLKDHQLHIAKNALRKIYIDNIIKQI